MEGRPTSIPAEIAVATKTGLSREVPTSPGESSQTSDAPKSEISAPTPSVVQVGAAARNEEAEPTSSGAPGLATEAPEAAPRNVSEFGLFTGPGIAASGGADIPSLEDVLAMGLYVAGVTPTHIVVRGTAIQDSVRCRWRGSARTIDQREDSIRFWLGLQDSDPLPTVAEAEREFMDYIDGMAYQYRDEMKARYMSIAHGGESDDLLNLTCYVDYSVDEYIVGTGATSTSDLTVAYDSLGEMLSYELHKLSHEAGAFGDEMLLGEDEYVAWLNSLVSSVELEFSQLFETHESVVFLAPMAAYNAIAIETWQAVTQWDLQEDQNGIVQAVRYGALPSEPRYSQPLSELRSRIVTAAGTDGHADERVANVSSLTQYYRDVGAYADITPDDGSTGTFVPAQPPEVPACLGVASVSAPRSNSDLVMDCTILLGSMDELSGTGSLDWSATTTVSSWEGVSLNSSSARVTSLDLSDEDLNGTLPAALGGLSALETLDLSDNELTGEIPAEFRRMWGLEEIRLSGNSLTGCIPVALESVATNDLASLGLLYCSPPAPANLVADAQGEGSVTLSWGAVSNTDMYRVEYRGGPALDWTDDDTSTSTSQTVTGLRCESSYLFRVSAHGSGTRYAAAWGPPSGLLAVTSGECMPPVFGAAPYRFGVAHDAASGTVVGTVTATDSPGDTVSYAITAGNGDGTFAIGEDTGEVTLATAVDDRLPAETALTVEASDMSGGTSVVDVSVYVARPPTDLAAVPTGDHGFSVTWSPAPGATEYSLRHRRSGSVEEHLVATPTEPAHVFHPAEGCATLHEFSVRAPVEGIVSPYTEPALEATCNLPPRFGQESYEFSVLEDATVGGPVGSVAATDAEGETLTYSVTSGNETGRFVLESATSSRIVLAAEVDHEERSGYALTVRVSDASGGSASVGVAISVTDVNEVPVAMGDTAETDVDTAVTIAVLENDTDEDDGDSLAVRSATGPANGTATVNTDGTVTYTPSAAYTGEDSFVYTVTDGTLTATATVSVTVRETCENGTAVPNPADNPELVEDCTVLLSVADTIAGEGSLDWSVDTPITEWEGVSARGEPARVQELRLDAADLSGTIPAELGGLSGLNFLLIAVSSFTGPIPAELGNLSNLRRLYIIGQGLTGTIPAELGNLSNLYGLRLETDGLTGSVPAELGNMSGLGTLNITANGLTGTIPPELGSLSNLQQMSLHVDGLTGSIPSELGGLSRLKRLTIRGSQLTGTIPAQLGDLNSLRGLTLTNSGFMGSIPSSLGNLSSLEGLELRRNRLSGSIPSELGDLSSLETLDLSQNRLTGSIPSTLGDLSELTNLRMRGNDFTGCIPAALRDVQYNDLYRLSVSYCE